MHMTLKQLRWAPPLLALGALALLAAACAQPGQAPGRSTGSYPIDIFQEMHYNQSFKAQEPPRLAPPRDSVPVTGSEVPLPETEVEADALVNPVQVTPAALERAAMLFQVNCAACHGLTAGGDGVVGQLFPPHGAVQPPAFGSDRVQALSPGAAYWVISLGEGFMPPFGSLLAPEDRWLLVHLVGLPADKQGSLLAGAKAPGAFGDPRLPSR
jgi:mono/diheme cytochrome c family protein